MKKALAILIAVLGNFLVVKAGHIAGGEMYYRYIGPGAAANTDRFEITLRLFRECNATGTTLADMPTEVIIGVFSRTSIDSYSLFSSTTVSRQSLNNISITPSAYPCIVPTPDVCYQVGVFVYERELPRNDHGYTVSFQTCCRSAGIINMQGFTIPSTQFFGDGATYVGNIPGMLSAPAPRRNSSPVFAMKDTAVICANNQFTLDFGATDPDNIDSLTYGFCSAYNRGDALGAVNITPSTPPYQFISYTSGFSGSLPLGSKVSINRQTGLISGIAPGAGKYIINVCIDEWRNGIKISEHRKDFTLVIKSCQAADAALEPSYTTCDGFTMSFQNLSTSPLNQTWYWDFGVAGVTTDTSTQEKPTFTYPDTGTYMMKLVVNRGRQCPDSSISPVRVYPGFFPSFTIDGACKDIPFRFIDGTTTNYGTVTGWRWNFGDETTFADTSQQQVPLWTYSTSGVKPVRLIVGNTKGCVDTVMQDVTVFDKPPLDLPFKDTLICSVDTLQLIANGTGNFSWAPAYNILNANSFNPLVYP
ncbi:MAG: PKD domain-containing protein, partial [Chitinophagaceae bacterium]